MQAEANGNSESACKMNLSEEEEEEPETCGTSGVGKQIGFPTSPLYSGSHFRGHQQSKGNKYNVEVILQVGLTSFLHQQIELCLPCHVAY